MQLSLGYLHLINIHLQISLQDLMPYCALSNLDIFWDEQLTEALKASLIQHHFQILAQSIDIQSSSDRFVLYLKVLPTQLEVDLSVIYRDFAAACRAIKRPNDDYCHALSKA